jgi:hypothetical protein
MRTGSRSAFGATLAAAALVGLSGCFIPIPAGPVNDAAPSAGPDLTIVYHLQPEANEDHVIVYGSDDPRAIAELVSPLLPMEDPQIETTTVGFDEIRAAIVYDATEKRMATKQGAEWDLKIETKPLIEAVAAEDVARLEVTVCHPTVEARVSPPGSNTVTDDCNLLGTTWETTQVADPFTIDVVLIAHESTWRLYVGLLAGWFALWSLIAVFVGLILRRDIPRAGGGLVLVATSLSLIGALFALGTSTAIGLLAGPSDNLALARDLGGSEWVAAALLPSTGAFVPVIALLVTLLLGLPWRRGREFRATHGARAAFGRPPPPPPA